MSSGKPRLELSLHNPLFILRSTIRHYRGLVWLALDARSACGLVCSWQRTTTGGTIMANATETPLPFQLRKIGHVVLNVTDLEAALRSYTEVLGLEVSDRYPDSM